MVLDPHPQQIADRRRGLARGKLEGLANARLALAGDHHERARRQHERAARAEPRAAEHYRQRPSVGPHDQERQAGWRGRRDLGLAAGALARDQERARRCGRKDADEHKDHQPTRHRYRAAFSM
jgi:hypothetical protein